MSSPQFIFLSSNEIVILDKTTNMLSPYLTLIEPASRRLTAWLRNRSSSSRKIKLKNHSRGLKNHHSHLHFPIHVTPLHTYQNVTTIQVENKKTKTLKHEKTFKSKEQPKTKNQKPKTQLKKLTMTMGPYLAL